MRWLQLLLAWLLLQGIVVAAGVRLGMTRAELEAELGRPTAVLARGEREILLYPNEGRVVLRAGRVIEFARVPVEGVTAVDPGLPAVPPARGPAAVEPPAEPPVTADATEGTPVIRTDDAAAGTPVEPGADWLEPDQAEVSAAAGWGGVALGFVVKVLVTIVVLKAAFAWADVHADWSQMILPALADGITRLVIVVAAQHLLGVDELFYVDEALAYFVLLAVLIKTTHACTLGRAVAVAGTAKVASIVVWSLLSVVLLQLAFG